MPYKNIHFIKIMLELFDDHRFIKECNDSQKLDYILWIAMAGLTQNEAPNDPEWFKTRFNLGKKVEEIEANTRFLTDIFKKMYKQQRGKKSVIKFTKFKDLHNYIGKSQGNPKDFQSVEQNRIDIDIDKNRIDSVLGEYLSLKKIDAKNNKELLSDLYARNGKPIKKLLAICKTPEEATSAMRWVGNWLDSKGLSWTIETVIKHYTTYLNESVPKTGLAKFEVRK